MRHRAPLLRFSSLQHTRSRVACTRGGQPPDHPASAFASPLRFSSMARAMRCSSTWRTCGVGRSMTFQVTEMTRGPSPSTSRAGESGETGHHARGKPNQIKRHRFGRTVRSSHAPSRPLAWRSTTPIELPRPCRAIWSSFLPVFLARRRSWVFTPFAGLLPRTGGATFLPRRAHVSFSPRVRPD